MNLVIEAMTLYLKKISRKINGRKYYSNTDYLLTDITNEIRLLGSVLKNKPTYMPVYTKAKNIVKIVKSSEDLENILTAIGMPKTDVQELIASYKVIDRYIYNMDMIM
jgi:hypothetical protein